MSKPRIAVLMSTYNGEKYIKEQIDSILAQRDTDVTLFVRDDGSTDATKDIVREYAKSHKNIHLYCDGKNLRPGKSFLKLLCYVVKYKEPFDYYAFSDQDDIWLEDKLIRGAEAIEDIEGPALYCSNQILYIDGKRERLRLDSVPEITLMTHITQNKMYGCTMVLNHELASLIESCKKPGNDLLLARNHDAWTILLALAVGKVVYDNDSYILYRIHDKNVVGVRDKTFMQRLTRFAHQSVRNLRSNSARYLLRALGETDFEDREYIELMAFYRNSLKNRLMLIKNADVCKSADESRLVFAAKVIIGYI